MVPDQKGGNANSEVTFREVLLVLFSVLGISAYQKFGSFERFYFIYYKYIWQLAFALTAILIGVTIWLVKSKTQGLTKRMELLSEAGATPESIYVGQTVDGAGLHLSEEQRCGHVQILGSTGRGKTESVIVPWICRDLRKGRRTILIDGKGDHTIILNILRQGSAGGRKTPLAYFDLGNPAKSQTINPLASGSAQQITDRIFTAFNFEEPYYKSVQMDVTLSVIQLIHEAKREVSFRLLYELLTDESVLTGFLSQSRNDILKKKLTTYLAQPTRTREEKMSGLLSQIAPFAVGEVAPLVNGRDGERAYCNVSDVLLNDEIPEQFFFALLIPTLKYQEIGHQLGKLILQELGWAIGERASQGKRNEFVPVFLDEFSSFVYPNFANILNKARSSNVALHLSHQSLGDLTNVSPSFAQIINTNTNVKCILGVNDPESADWIASHFGTLTTEKVTERAQKAFLNQREKTGDLSMREVEAYKVHPNLLKSFVCGRGVLHLPTVRGNVTEVIQFERVGKDG